MQPPPLTPIFGLLVCPFSQDPDAFHPNFPSRNIKSQKRMSRDKTHPILGMKKMTLLDTVPALPLPLSG